MMRAALCVAGRVVVADSHLACWQKLSEAEQNADLDSGFYDPDAQRFISDKEQELFDDKELYLVRHGTVADTHDRDPDMDEAGEQQVYRMAQFLCTRNVEQFVGVTSPLLRCLKTAQIISEVLGIHFEIVPEVMESPTFLKSGNIFKLKNRSADFPQFDWPTSKEWHVLPETQHDFYERVKDTLQRIPPRSIIVTHQGYICLTAKLALAKKLFTEGFPPASVTYFHRHDAQRLGWTDEEVLQDRPEAEYRQAGRRAG